MEYSIEITLENTSDYLLLRSELSNSKEWEVKLPVEHRGGGPAALAKRVLYLRKKDLKNPSVKIGLVMLAIDLISRGIGAVSAMYGNGDGEFVIENNKIEINIGGDVIYNDSANVDKLKKLIDE